jgi:fimbrial chaperone protein
MINSTKKRNNKIIPGDHIPLRIFAWAIAGLVCITFTPSQGFAANFSITPTFLDLSSGAKSGAFSVINGGEEKLTCQIEVKEWAQDAEGKDAYTETKDIVLFPQIMTVAPNEQRAIRIGIKAPPGPKEKTYRLFVMEIPSQKKEPEGKGTGKINAGLTIAFQYSVPIFVKPIRQQESGIMEKVEMSGGTARAVIRNTGNIHFKLNSVMFRGKAADGTELFSKELTGWYVLHGLARSYEAAVPREVCDKLSTIEVKAHAENFGINGNMNVLRAMCIQ